jgi:hypothetical protein
VIECLAINALSVQGQMLLDRWREIFVRAIGHP